MRILAVLCIVSLAVGCATTLTDEEAAKCESDDACMVKTLEDKIQQEQFDREHKRAIDFDNYLMCSRLTRPMVHVNHRHGKRDRVSPWMIKSDLMYNNCRAIIGREGWAKY